MTEPRPRAPDIFAPDTGLFSFMVRGLPAPQGSKRAIVNRHTGKAVVMEQSTRVRPWRSDVRDGALAVLGPHAPWSGPVGVDLDFRLPRPRGHYGTGRNAELLRAGAPLWPAKPPDLDKLARAILDALTGLAYLDDSQVCLLALGKSYAPGPQWVGVTITLRDLSRPGHGLSRAGGR